MWKPRPRLRTFDYIGKYRYFLTFCTPARRRLFLRADVVDLARSEILRAARAQDFTVPAYVFMPDHAHLLAHGSSDASDLKAFVKLAKQYSGYAYSQAHGQSLWQSSYYDHALRDDESDLQVMWYVVSNPVRAGRAARPEDYPFVGSTTYSIAEIVARCAEVRREASDPQA